MASRHLTRGLLIAIILVLAFCLWLVVKPKDRSPKHIASVTSVVLGKPETRSWPIIVESTGTLNGKTAVMLKAKVSGEIKSILTAQSQKVKANTPLLQIDPQGLQSQLKRAKASHQLAKTHLDELSVLVKKGATPKWQFQQAQSTFLTTQADVSKLEEQLALSKVVAPFSGEIGIYQVQLGDFVLEGAPLVQIEDTSTYRVDFNIPGEFAPQTKEGQTVLINNSEQQQIARAITIGKAVRIDNATQTFHLRAIIKAKRQVLTPGQFVHTRLMLNEHRQVLTVPQEAVSYTDEGNFIFIVDKKNQAKEIAIKVGRIYQGQIEIEQGLKGDETIVVIGHHKIHSGSLVKAAKAR